MFENMHASGLVLWVFWNIRPPKRAPRQPKILPRWLQKASKSPSKKESDFALFSAKRTSDWPQKKFRLAPKVFQKMLKSCLKNDPKTKPKMTKLWTLKWTPEPPKTAKAGHGTIRTEVSKKALGPKMPPRWLKMVLRWPKIASSWPKSVPR